MYVVYATKQGIFGGCVAGMFYNNYVSEVTLQDAYPLMRPLVRRWLKKRRSREHYYRSLELNPEAFLNADRRNFAIAPLQIASINLHQGWTVWASQGVGSLTIELGTGKRWELVLIGRQNIARVEDTIRECYPSLKVTGNPTTIQIAKRRIPSDAKNDRLITFATFTGIAAIGCILAIVVEEPERFTTGCLLLAAVVCSVLTLLLIKRWRKNEAIKKLNDAIVRNQALSVTIHEEAESERLQPSDNS